MMAPLALLALAGCPDDTWRHNSVTDKCYKIAPGYVGTGDCVEKCGTDASLACIQSAADHEYVYRWLTDEGVPGTPRQQVWIGNYRTDDDTDGNWTGCAGGQTTAFTNWTTVRANAEPRNSLVNPDKPLQCALFHVDGWYSRECLSWYPCLCESGTPTSAEFVAFHERHLSEWMAPWNARGAWTLVGGALIGIIPALAVLACSCAIRKTESHPDWSRRVKGRVANVMLVTGWLVLALGSAPVVAFFIGFHAVYSIGYPQGWAALVPVGISCWLLAIVPTNPTSTRGALVGGIVFFVFFALIGLGAVAFWGVLSLWIAGLVMGIIFVVFGVGAAIVSGMAMCKFGNDPRARLRRLWACMRLFFVLIFFVCIGQFLEYVVNLNSQWSENSGWIAWGLSSLLCAILTHPPWRNAVCVWLATSGRTKIGDRKGALDAAMLIWIDVETSTARTEPDSGIQA